MDLEVKQPNGNWVLLDDYEGPRPIDPLPAAELFELVALLWPTEGYQTVQLETHQ